MNEFKMLKKMLEKTGAVLEITIWDSLDESLIEDKTNQIAYWFKNNELYFINNDLN